MSFPALAAAQNAPVPAPTEADRRADDAVAAMTIEERIQLVHGIMALPVLGLVVPERAVLGAGFIPGVPRLGIPDIRETDASLGVAWANGSRKDGATALPSGMALASSWDPGLMERGGAMIGAEARAKGFNVMLAGGVNLIREPRGGRTFEYLSEDPLLSGILVGASIRGVQSNHIVSTIKHFALNDHETARRSADILISDAAARESDLLAFQIGIEEGQPGSVMCAYNKINGHPACASDYLLNTVLKRDWGFKGWVMSDWGATPGIEAAIAGLDQQSGEQLDKAVHFGAPLAQAARRDPAIAARLGDMAQRVVRGLFAVGADKLDGKPVPIDFEANARVAQEAAAAGIVLLRNERNALPLADKARKIAVIGGYADIGVPAGGGASMVHGVEGPALSIPYRGDNPVGHVMPESYHRSVPLKALRERARDSEVVYRDGRYIAEAVQAARGADVAIVFATQFLNEGYDVPDLSLPGNQEALIAAVAAANPNTIVVLETGGPVTMPWLDQTAAVIEAWYPGARGAEAIAAVLFGDVNPGGRLPVTFPASIDQLPRPKIDGFDVVEPEFDGRANGRTFATDYNIEGSDVGYRWFVRQKTKPLFPFGFGLSYTRFEQGSLALAQARGRISATARVRNTGDRAGSTVVQLYLVEMAGKPVRRLVGFQKVELAPGEEKGAAFAIDPRLLASWSQDHWRVAAGSYAFALGTDAERLGKPFALRLDAQRHEP